MIEVNRIIAELNVMKEKTLLYINPANTDTLFHFLYGLERCFLLSSDESEIRSRVREFVDTRLEAISERGWKVLSVIPVREMRDKGMTEEEIIQELIEIDILKWKIWNKRENGKN